MWIVLKYKKNRNKFLANSDKNNGANNFKESDKKKMFELANIGHTNQQNMLYEQCSGMNNYPCSWVVQILDYKITIFALSVFGFE